jgi:hypothetical protein
MVLWKDTGQAFMEACDDQIWKDIFSWSLEHFVLWATVYEPLAAVQLGW